MPTYLAPPLTRRALRNKQRMPREHRNGEMLRTRPKPRPCARPHRGVGLPQPDHDSTPKGLAVKTKTVKTEEREIELSALTLEQATQSRTAVRADVVDEYEAALRSGDEFPRITVVTDGESNWVVDGWHRVEAMSRIDANGKIAASVIHGSFDDAVWHAARANRTHGLRRSNADKVRSVTLALQVRPKEALRVIAEWCGVSHEMVRQYKAALEAPAPEPEEAAAAAQEAIDEARDSVPFPTLNRMALARGSLGLCMRKIAEIEKRIDEIIGGNDGVWVNGQSVKSDLKNAQSALSQAMPHSACPLCAGNGCSSCRDAGWVSKRQYLLLPKQQ